MKRIRYLVIIVTFLLMVVQFSEIKGIGMQEKTLSIVRLPMLNSESYSNGAGREDAILNNIATAKYEVLIMSEDKECMESLLEELHRGGFPSAEIVVKSTITIDPYIYFGFAKIEDVYRLIEILDEHRKDIEMKITADGDKFLDIASFKEWMKKHSPQSIMVDMERKARAADSCI